MAAIMGALECIAMGMSPSIAVFKYSPFGAKVRNIQKWKRDISDVLSQSADQVDLSHLPSSTDFDSLLLDL